MKGTREYFSIPNLMGYFRIALLPVFLLLYYRADEPPFYIAALLVLAVSFLTDFLDGKIARKFNMVTDFGKILDPVADKLTQGGIALALTFQYPLTVRLLAFFLLKELYMAVMGLVLMKKSRKITGALWYGKACTCILDVGILLLLFVPNLSGLVSNAIIYLLMTAIAFTWAMYLVYHMKVLKSGEKIPEKEKGKKKTLLIAVMLLLAVLCFVISAILPYRRQPEVSREYREAFQAESFYGEGISSDRAVVIEDNGDALRERIRLISQAQERIILSTYEMRSDTSGMQIMAALRAAALRGVQVELLLDGFAFWTQVEGNPYFYALETTDNVEIIVYNKANVLTPWKGMSRMHEKYIIADDRIYLAGGRNTFDFFLGDQEGHKNYDRDVLVYNTGGADSSVYDLIAHFEGIIGQNCCSLWTHGKLLENSASVKRAAAELDRLYLQMQEENPRQFESINYTDVTFPVNHISLVSNPGGLYPKEPWVFWSLCQLIKYAGAETIIHTPYIICNDYMYTCLTEICRKNEKVVVMTNASSTNGNYFGAVDYALNKEKILNTGLKILEYSGNYSYHGKSILIGDRLSAVGSFNMDIKSAYQNTELMLVIDSREVNEQLKDIFLSYQREACPAVLSASETEELLSEDVPWGTRVLRRIIMQLDPWLRFLM
ncbi:MAG: CDP-diacylglycerol--glycerol-3-phosphate 3-phosphatidyltransferase [Lachnospiraceae bacterium]|nr:CDP-alcohol phosphatidyltransferase family protein [uncultured Acetatifactor sp.]MCI8286427.1 CDP-diacylglycerol--glycerol-3-phosphate 3-phosphatidyltransferase [Lachnospiraceae bacterium]